VLSEVDSRYQSRVIFLIPLAAGLILLDLLHRRRQNDESGSLGNQADGLRDDPAARVAIP
jgi:hypothetical protein